MEPGPTGFRVGFKKLFLTTCILQVEDWLFVGVVRFPVGEEPVAGVEAGALAVPHSPGSS